MPLGVTRRTCLTLLGGAAVARPHAVHAQSLATVARLGVLSGGAPVADASPVGAALLRGLAQHGYTSGGTCTSCRGADGFQTACRPSSMTSLVARPVEVIVTIGYPAALAAKQGTTLPVVAINAGDPVRRGWWRAWRGRRPPHRHPRTCRRT